MTKLDQEIIDEIRNLAITNPKKLIDKYLDMTKLQICKRRKMQQSFQQIANAMRMPKTTVYKICKKCDYQD